MGDLSKNLSRHEMECKCGCGFDTVDAGLVDILQQAVNHFEALLKTNIYLVITGPNRCPAHNKKVGGSKNSQHIYGRAADHKLKYKDDDGKMLTVDPDVVADYYEHKYRDIYGIGKYNGRTHIDNRTDGPARWDVR